MMTEYNIVSESLRILLKSNSGEERTNQSSEYISQKYESNFRDIFSFQKNILGQNIKCHALYCLQLCNPNSQQSRSWQGNGMCFSLFACFRQLCHAGCQCWSQYCDHELSSPLSPPSDVAPAALLLFPGPAWPGHQPAGGAGWPAAPPQPTPPPPARHLHCRLLPHLARPTRVRRGPGRDARREAGAPRREQVAGYSAQPPPENALEQHRGKKVCIMSCHGPVVGPQWLTFDISTSCPTSQMGRQSQFTVPSPGLLVSWSCQKLLPNRLLVDCHHLSYHHHLSPV